MCIPCPPHPPIPLLDPLNLVDKHQPAPYMNMPPERNLLPSEHTVPMCALHGAFYML